MAIRANVAARVSVTDYDSVSSAGLVSVSVLVSGGTVSVGVRICVIKFRVTSTNLATRKRRLDTKSQSLL